jgi:hypothetical protein
MENYYKRERLGEIYPEARKMRDNNKGYDWLVPNKKGMLLRDEEKFRSPGVKVDITKAQVYGSDIITLCKPDTKGSLKFNMYHMATEKYREIAKPHSALKSGYTDKVLEVSQKKFIENATTDLNVILHDIERQCIDLMDFAA